MTDQTPQPDEYRPRFPGGAYADAVPRLYVAVTDRKGGTLGRAELRALDAHTVMLDSSTGSRDDRGEVLGLTYGGHLHSCSAFYRLAGTSWEQISERGPYISRYFAEKPAPTHAAALAEAMLRAVNDHPPSPEARAEAQARKLREEAEHWAGVRELSDRLSEYVAQAETALGHGQVPPRLYVTELRDRLDEHARRLADAGEWGA